MAARGWLGVSTGGRLGLVRLVHCLIMIGEDRMEWEGPGGTGGSVGLAGRLSWCAGIGCGQVGEGLAGVAHALSCARSQPPVLGPARPILAPHPGQHLPPCTQHVGAQTGVRGGGGAARPQPRGGAVQKHPGCPAQWGLASPSPVAMGTTAAGQGPGAVGVGGHPTLASPHPLGALCILEFYPTPKRILLPKTPRFWGTAGQVLLCSRGQ